MNTEINTRLVHRTWFEKLRMWRHTYETKIFDDRHEVVVRGPTPDAARKAALKQWNEQMNDGGRRINQPDMKEAPAKRPNRGLLAWVL